MDDIWVMMNQIALVKLDAMPVLLALSGSTKVAKIKNFHQWLKVSFFLKLEFPNSYLIYSYKNPLDIDFALLFMNLFHWL